MKGFVYIIPGTAEDSAELLKSIGTIIWHMGGLPIVRDRGTETVAKDDSVLPIEVIKSEVDDRIMALCKGVIVLPGDDSETIKALIEAENAKLKIHHVVRSKPPEIRRDALMQFLRSLGN